MKDIVIDHIQQRFGVLRELAESLTDSQLSMKLDLAKSKSAVEHFWCVVGARESYFKALLVGKWSGFSCSLTDSSNRSDYIAALQRTETQFHSIVEQTSWSSDTEELLVNLLEHETMHEGQLIRLVYGLNLKMPISSKWA